MLVHVTAKMTLLNDRKDKLTSMICLERHHVGYLVFEREPGVFAVRKSAVGQWLFAQWDGGRALTPGWTGDEKKAGLFTGLANTLEKLDAAIDGERANPSPADPALNRPTVPNPEIDNGRLEPAVSARQDRSTV